jgi:hypothetical protein
MIPAKRYATSIEVLIILSKKRTPANSIAPGTQVWEIGFAPPFDHPLPFTGEDAIITLNDYGISYRNSPP